MRLQRITTSSRWIPELDGLRFVAISCVLLIHILAQMATHANRYGVRVEGHETFLSLMYQLGRGVQLFFAISGYILAQPFLRQHVDGGRPVNIGRFYLRRLTRLEPPYILSLLIYAAGVILGHRMPPHDVWRSFAMSAFYVHTFFAASVRALNLVTWSLEVEVQFYLLVPLLALIFCIRRSLWRRLALISCILISALPNWSSPVAHGFLLPTQLCYFFTGFLLADLRVEQRLAQDHPLWDLSSLLIWPAFLFVPEFRFLPVLLCGLLIAGFHATFMGPISRTILSTRWVALFGGMCYSTYLLHMFVISTLSPLTRHAAITGNLYSDYLIQLLLLLPSIAAASIVYFVLVERPCMDPQWPQKLWARLQGRRSATNA
ncbi:MAG TPA: acyltransferase [Terriglobus sp.]